MEVSAPGLTAILNNSGAVDFVDANGIMQYHVGIPYMEDAAGAVLGNKNISVEISQVGNAYTITYTPDEEWLTAPEREYPILLDPSITTKEYNSNIVDTYVVAGDTSNHSSEQKMYYGVRSGKIHRAYIKINNLPNIDANMPIISAKMQLFFTSGTNTGKTAQIYSLDSSWSPSTITYANQPTISANNLIATCPYSSSVMSMTFDLSSDINTLYTDFFAAVNYGYVIKYADESNTNPDYNVFYTTEYTTASKRPVMTINYGYALPSSLTSGETYSFQNAGSGKYMTVHNGTDANDVNVYQTDYVEGAASQKFKLEYVSSTGGYRLRAMCSSNGAGRSLHAEKMNTYVLNGSNVKIYTSGDELAQYWFIIGLGAKNFKIVPRTDMSLALTAYGDGNGTSSGTSTTSEGNVFVSTYTSDSYQIWRIRDSDNVALMSGATTVSSGTYYINNKSSGKYLHYAATGVDGASGLIASLENTIRWKITPVGDNKYTIQSLENMQKYLYAENSTDIGLDNPTSLTDEYLWILTVANEGGFLIYNASNQKCLLHSETIGLSTIPTSGSLTYEQSTWRLASTEEYGNTSDHPLREVRSGFKFNTVSLMAGEVKIPVLLPDFPYDYLWYSVEDFTYTGFDTSRVSLHTPTSAFIAANFSEQYSTSIIATHKVTGLSAEFTLVVNPNAQLIGVAALDVDNITPLPTVKTHLDNMGYISEIHTGAFTVDDIRNYLTTPENNVFVSLSHGGTVENYEGQITGTLIQISEAPASTIHFTSSMMNFELNNMKLVLFVGCETGKNRENGPNLPHSAVERGATVAIGFEQKIDAVLSNDWLKDFFKELANGESVSGACDELDNDDKYKNKCVYKPVICGDGSVTLG